MKHEIELMLGYLQSTQKGLDRLLNRSDDIITQLIDLPLHDSTNLYFIGNGSSGEDVRIASFLAVRMLGILPHCCTPYSFTHGLVDAVRSEDIVIAISQTGTSHEVVESLRLAKARGAHTIALTATKDSPVALNAEIPFVFEECVEDVAYKVTGVLGLLYGLWIVILGLAFHNVRITKTELLNNLHEIRTLNKRYDELVVKAERWTEKNVELFESHKTFTVLGTGDMAEIAMEFAIKSIEIQGRFSFAVETEEFLHGICAVNTPDNLIVMIVDPKSEAYARRVYEAIKSRKQDVVWIGQGALDNGLKLDMLKSEYYMSAQFFPVVHACLVTWARLKGYGDYGSTVFADYQHQLKVREE